jgi:ketosteroid isomerase-like protein
MSDESTTPDLVELTRRVQEAGERGDWDAAMSFFAPGAVWDLSLIGLGMLQGRAAIRGFFEDWVGAYERLAFEADEVLDLGNGVGLRVATQRGRPAGSTAGSSGEVRQRLANVGLWVDGLIERVTSYQDIDEARAVAERLAEERAQADG